MQDLSQAVMNKKSQMHCQLAAHSPRRYFSFKAEPVSATMTICQYLCGVGDYIDLFERSFGTFVRDEIVEYYAPLLVGHCNIRNPSIFSSCGGVKHGDQIFIWWMEGNNSGPIGKRR